MPSKISRFVHRGGLVRFFWGNNGAMISHSLSVKLLEYGIYFSSYLLLLKILNGFYTAKKTTQSDFKAGKKAIKAKTSVKTEILFLERSPNFSRRCIALV